MTHEFQSNTTHEADQLLADHGGVSLVNASPAESLPIELTFASQESIRVEGRVLTANRLDAHNTFEEPDVVKPQLISNLKPNQNTIKLTLPPASVSVITVR